MMLGTAGGAGEKGGELGAMTMLMFLVRYFNFTRSFSRDGSLKNKKKLSATKRMSQNVCLTSAQRMASYFFVLSPWPAKRRKAHVNKSKGDRKIAIFPAYKDNNLAQKAFLTERFILNYFDGQHKFCTFCCNYLRRRVTLPAIGCTQKRLNIKKLTAVL